MSQEKNNKTPASRPSRRKPPAGYNHDTVVETVPGGKRTIAQRKAGSAKSAAEAGGKRKTLLVTLLVAVVVLAAGAAVIGLASGGGNKTGEVIPTGETVATEPTETLVEEEPETEAPTEPRVIEVGTDVLAKYSTDISGTEDRTHNLILACQAVDGTVLDVDEEFSFNRILGERTEEKGYRPASIYADGAVVDGVGGGICQVASTIYLVALKSDLKITERHVHQFPVSYLPLGMDASIYWGSQDLRFVNTSGYPIRILASVKNNCVNITIEGTKLDDGYIRMSYEIVDTYDYEEIEKEDKTKEPGYRREEVSGVTGYLVKTFYNYYDSDDNLISKVECAWSEYNKRDRVIIVGPQEDDDNIEETDGSDGNESEPEYPTEPEPEYPTETDPEDTEPDYDTEPPEDAFWDDDLWGEGEEPPTDPGIG